MLPLFVFESVFNISPIGTYLLSPSPEATILAVNDAFLKASSRRREDLVGKSLFEAFPGNPEHIHWSVEDPAASSGTEEDRQRAFDSAAKQLLSRIRLWLALPRVSKSLRGPSPIPRL